MHDDSISEVKNRLTALGRLEIWISIVDLFGGDEPRACSWLLATAFGLGNVAPVDYANSESGAGEVLDLIGRIKNGVFS